MVPSVPVKLIDGTTVEVNDRATIERLWKTNKVSLVDAASCLTALLGIHPSNARRVWSYLTRASG
jgi:hypothetical protein